MRFVARLHGIAARHPDVPALEDGGLVLSYAQLVDRARWTAEGLSRAGVGPGTRVAHGYTRSADAVVAMWATWMLGAAVVPIPADWPGDRRADMIRRARPTVVVGERDAGLAVPLVPAVGGTGPGSSSEARSGPEGQEAWVIFTSGSTGRAQGVCVLERGVSGLVDAQIATFGLGPGSRALWMLSPGFDATFSDILTAHLSGATLVVAPGFRTAAALGAWMERAGITHADLPPALLGPLLAVRPASLQVVVAGGEPAPPAVVRRWAGVVRFVNVYGPTEGTVCTSLGVVDPKDWDMPRIGRPIPGVRYKVADGELWIAGDCLAAGYLHDEALTAARFVYDDVGERWFRTGDRVRARSDGDHAYLGRLDRMVKIHGRRVELGEVEVHLSAVPGVSRCAVVADDVGLAAFIVPEAGAVELPAVRTALGRSLPTWMIPGRIENVHRLPEGPSGKVDFRALAARDRRPVGGAGGGPTVAARIWSDVLGRAVDDGDDLNVAGRDSIAVLEVLARAEACGLPVDPEQIATGPTPADTFRARPTPSAGIRRSVAELRACAPGLPAFGPPRSRTGIVLVTGGTGFLGAAVVARLSREWEGVRCLVRAAGPLAARGRLLAALEGLDADLQRVEAIVGDLEAPGLGITDLSALADVDRVVHLGARVDVASPYAVVAPSIVGGTQRVLEFAASVGVRSIVFVSSLAVFVNSDHAGGVITEVSDPDDSVRLRGGYAQARWVADGLMRAVGEPKVAVLRPGLIVPDASGRWTERAQLRLFVRGLAKIGAVPDALPSLRLDLTPVGIVVDAISKACHQELGGVFHLAHPTGATFFELLEAVTRAGAPVTTVPQSAWGTVPTEGVDVAMVRLGLARALQPAPIGDADDRLLAYDMFLASRFSFDCTATWARLGLRPLPAAEQLLDRCAQVALGGGR